ncbi:hypothetical protein JNB70_25010, partial [Rhizobium pusense]|nr:hypothetical protein [Agrobacterium pusense]
TSDMLRAPAGGGAAGADALASQARLAGENIAAKRALNTRLAGELRNAGAPLPAGVTLKAGDANAAGSRQPGAAIEEHFAQINQLGAGTSGATPLDHSLTVLDQLGKTLLTMNDLSDPAAQNSPALLAARQEAGQLPPQVAALIQGLTGKSADLVASGSSAALADQ